MGADISIIKAAYQPFNHCIDVADDMQCKSNCCGDYSTCTCDTKNTHSRQSESTLGALSESSLEPVQQKNTAANTQRDK